MRSFSFHRFQSEVLCLYEPPIRAKGTWRQMRQVLREFAELPGLRTMTDVRPPIIAAWIHAYPERSPARASSLLRSFASACSYAVASGYIKQSPFSFRRVNQWVRNDVLAPDKPRVPCHQSAASIERLLEMLDGEAAGGSWKAGRLQALTYLLAYTGVRKEEALHLKTWDVDLVRRIVSIEPRRTFRPKTKKSAARLPIAEPLAVVLALWLPRCGADWVFPGVKLRGPWTGGCPGYKPLDEVRAAGERAGIPGLTIAGFRKTVGTLAKSWGMGQLELKALLRHSNVETQRWYDEEAVESLRPAVSRITYRVAVPP
jgi:integrase